MKKTFGRALLGAIVCVGPALFAEEMALVARDESAGASRSEASELATSSGVVANSRGEDAAPAKPPVAKPVTPPPTSRADSGTLVRATVSNVVAETSHLVVKADASLQHYRFTKGTHFVDEQGGVLTADAVKSGTVATLHFTHTDGDTVLTRVVITRDPRPMVSSHLAFEVPAEP